MHKFAISRWFPIMPGSCEQIQLESDAEEDESGDGAVEHESPQKALVAVQAQVAIVARIIICLPHSSLSTVVYATVLTLRSVHSGILFR